MERGTATPVNQINVVFLLFHSGYSSLRSTGSVVLSLLGVPCIFLGWVAPSLSSLSSASSGECNNPLTDDRYVRASSLDPMLLDSRAEQ